MFNSIKRFFTARNGVAERQFLRFLKLRFETYADLCVYGVTADSDDNHDQIASACREWLPGLSNPLHRRVCEALSDLHEASSDRALALDSLMTSLDEIRSSIDVSFDPTRVRRGLIDVVVRDPATGNSHFLDFKTAPSPSATSDASPRPLCSYCADREGVPASFLSGKTVHVCDSSECITRHDAALRAEYTQCLLEYSSDQSQVH